MAHAVLVGLALLAASCTPPPHTLAPGDQSKSYFPLVKGAHWIYELDLGFGKTEIDFEARGETAVDGLDGVLFVVDEHALGETFGLVERSPTAYMATGGFLSRITALDYDRGGKLRSLGREEPNWILPLLPEPGQLWTQRTRVFNLKDGGGGGDVRWEGEVLTRGDFDVPAGHFEDVLVVRIQYHDPRAHELGPLITYEDAYARGIGLIHSVARNELEGSTIVTQRLVRYQFP